MLYSVYKVPAKALTGANVNAVAAASATAKPFLDLTFVYNSPFVIRINSDQRIFVNVLRGLLPMCGMRPYRPAMRPLVLKGHSCSRSIRCVRCHTLWTSLNIAL